MKQNLQGASRLLYVRGGGGGGGAAKLLGIMFEI